MGREKITTTLKKLVDVQQIYVYYYSMSNGDHEHKDEAHQLTYENETQLNRTVTIPLREYDKLQEQKKYITDKSLIDIIDNVERLVRALRKHIIRHDLEENFLHKKDSE